MLFKKEFPDYDDELFMPEGNGWFDNSYHNNTCPCVCKRYEEDGLEIVVNVWQEYKDIRKREYDGSLRYLFQIVVNDIDVFIYETDDLDKIKELCSKVTNIKIWER